LKWDVIGEALSPIINPDTRLDCISTDISRISNRNINNS